jgi:hypothetical protein
MGLQSQSSDEFQNAPILPLQPSKPQQVPVKSEGSPTGWKGQYDSANQVRTDKMGRNFAHRMPPTPWH